ncbi:MAG: hypothetical protein RLZZ342_593 [Candidatus Parcubacteria bacterium]|jgi:hypothetical protein
MNLSLRRFEIILIGIVAVGTLTFTALYLISGKEPSLDSVFLLPRPTVLNEKEAILRQVSASSEITDATEEERLGVLKSLQKEEGTSSAPMPSVEDRLRVLEQISASK